MPQKQHDVKAFKSARGIGIIDRVGLAHQVPENTPKGSHPSAAGGRPPVQALKGRQMDEVGFCQIKNALEGDLGKQGDIAAGHALCQVH